MSHTMKVWQRIIEARLRDRDQKTPIWIYARKGKHQCHVCFENVDGKVQGKSKRATLCICGTREILRHGSAGRAVELYEKIRNSGKVCCNLYRYIPGKRNSGEVCSRNYRKFQGALSPFLFAVIMDKLTDEVRRELTWTMLFADDIVIFEETREELEQRIECWRFAFERIGMKVSRSKAGISLHKWRK